MEIDYDDFINFCKKLEVRGETINTIGDRSSFEIISVDQSNIKYKLLNGNIRSTERNIIQKVLKKFGDTESYTTTKYTDITQASSYTLALIKLYMDSL